MEKNDKLWRSQDGTISMEYKGFSFRIDRNDWESAAIPICCIAISDEDLMKIAQSLFVDFKDVVDYHIERGEKEEDLDDDYLWGEYEKAILNAKGAFYYEDLNNEDKIEILNNPTRETALKLWFKLKNEEL